MTQSKGHMTLFDIMLAAPEGDRAIWESQKWWASGILQGEGRTTTRRKWLAGVLRYLAGPWARPPPQELAMI